MKMSNKLRKKNIFSNKQAHFCQIVLGTCDSSEKQNKINKNYSENHSTKLNKVVKDFFSSAAYSEYVVRWQTWVS